MAKDRKPRTVVGPGKGNRLSCRNPGREIVRGQRTARELRDVHLDRLALKSDRASRDRIRMQRGLV